MAIVGGKNPLSHRRKITQSSFTDNKYFPVAISQFQGDKSSSIQVKTHHLTAVKSATWIRGNELKRLTMEERDDSLKGSKRKKKMTLNIQKDFKAL